MLEGGHELAIVVVEHDRLGAARRGRGVRFITPHPCQLRSAKGLMAFVAVRQCDVEHAPATRGGQGGDAARRNLAVVRVRSNDQKRLALRSSIPPLKRPVRCIKFDAHTIVDCRELLSLRGATTLFGFVDRQRPALDRPGVANGRHQLKSQEARRLRSSEPGEEL